MEWDKRLDEIFEDMDKLLDPCASRDVYGVLKKMRDLMKELAKVMNDSAT